MIARGEVVLADRLVDELWPGEASAVGRGPLRTHVWRLRGHLGPFADRLQSTSVGYRLRLAEGESDLHVLDTTVPAVRRLVAATPSAAVPVLEGLVDLWRGDALAEFVDLPAFLPEQAAIAALRSDLVDELIGAMVGIGLTRRAIDVAMRVAAAEPLRERTQQLLMCALAADGRRGGCTPPRRRVPPAHGRRDRHRPERRARADRAADPRCVDARSGGGGDGAHRP